MPTCISKHQGWIMAKIFNYATIDVELIKKSRTLLICLKESHKAFGLEVMFELESILAWAASKVEIHSILIRSYEGTFSDGISLDSLPMLKEKTLQKITEKLQKITYALFHLPQTVVIDLGAGAKNLAAELAIGADIRIAHQQTQVSFDHTFHGLVPCSGGMGVLTTTIGSTYAKNWVLMGKTIAVEQLIHSGFLLQTYQNDREELTEQILSNIHRQSPVQRVQAKLGLYQGIKDSLEEATRFEKQIGTASRVTQDWKEKRQDRMPAKNMSKAVKLSLIKNHSADPVN